MRSGFCGPPLCAARTAVGPPSSAMNSRRSFDDAACVVDEDGIHPTEFDNRRRDLRYLVLAVRAGVARIWDQSIEWPVLGLT
jgi:hypothetical protein